MAVKPKGPTKAALKRKIIELEAQLASTYHFADASIEKVKYPQLMASGVILQLHVLGGREIIPPVMIKDGLSDATIAAIRADLRRSYELAVECKPRPE